MSPNTSPASTAAPAAERRPAVWPWLLLPLVVLTMFFVLKTVRDSLPAADTGPHLQAPAGSASSEDADGSR